MVMAAIASTIGTARGSTQASCVRGLSVSYLRRRCSPFLLHQQGSNRFEYYNGSKYPVRY